MIYDWWTQDGDFVASRVVYGATNLPSNLYIEGIQGGDYIITVELDPDGRSGFICSDSVRVRVVGVDIAMDGNRDGTIEFNNPADSKYLFWVNDDHDCTHNEEDMGVNAWHEDDSLAWVDGADNPNCEDNHIGAKGHWGTGTLPDSENHCRRDLEDFTRVHIKVEDQLAQTPGITYCMQSSPSVNIFEAIDETPNYLKVGSIADQQIQKLRLLALNGGEVQLPNQYIKTGSQISPFILEGCSAGTGKLSIIVKKDGTEICRKSVRLEFRAGIEKYNYQPQHDLCRAGSSNCP